METKTDIDICITFAPFENGYEWEVESLLLKIFEYGDYSFRSALSGEYSQSLNCVFFLAKHNDNIIGAAGCLYSKKNPAIAIIGPVCVLPEYRSKGIGTELLESIVEHLKEINGMAAYLAVNNSNPAVSMYSKIGFMQYQGIVRRLLLREEKVFDKLYFNNTENIHVRKAIWGDFPGIQALIAEPGDMYSINYQKHIFSSRYVEPERFLSIFPDMMKENKKHGGILNVLVSSEKENVVGFANIGRLPGKAQEHVGELEFFVHDNFIENSVEFVKTTIRRFRESSVKIIYCYCVGCDRIKRDIIESVGGNLIGTLPDNIFLNGSYEDALIYEIRGNK
jgi:ribosomal protein S18 acetylase RimI-like enzyme